MTQAELDKIKAQLKALHITISELAFQVGKSPSWISSVLNGNYPYMYASSDGKAALPRAVADKLRWWRIEVPDNM